jgi:hypothetical protein
MTQRTHANDDETNHQPDDAITMLTADHRQVRALFQQYEDTSDPYLKQIIAEHVFAELTLHMLLEETVGGVSHVLGLSEGLSKLIAIDKQPNHQIVHLFGLGKTNRTAH